MASRHLARSIALQSLFEWDFYKKTPNLAKITERNIAKFGGGFDEDEFVRTLTKEVKDKITEIDEIISVSAPKRPISQLSLVDRNILRLGLLELLFSNPKAVPPKVAINEAVELAKRFGTNSSARFINGVLGTVYQQLKKQSKNENNN